MTATSPKLSILRPCRSQVVHCRIVIVQVICIIHQIAQLCLDRCCSCGFLILHLRHIDTSHKRFSIQLEQLFSKLFSKAVAFSAICQVTERESVFSRRFAKDSPHTVVHTLKLKIQTSTVCPTLPRYVFFFRSLLAMFRPAVLGKPYSIALMNAANVLFAETVRLLNYR